MRERPDARLDRRLRWQELGLDLRVAAGSDVPLLITGRRDVTRLVARAIHDGNSRREPTRFVIGERETLFETLASMSTRFRGAHESAAVVDAPNSLATLYIDQVEQMTPDLQEMLLYFLDVVYAPSAADQRVRVIAATTDDLTARVGSGVFREDLFYRLNVVHLAMPRVWGTDDARLHSLLALLAA